MSLRSAGDMLSAFGESLSRASAVGADETRARVKGKKTTIGIVTDTGTGQILGLDALAEREFGRLHGLAGGLRG